MTVSPSQKQGGWTPPREFVSQIAASDVQDGDIIRLQMAVLYGGILKKEDKREVSQTLGVLRAILETARANPSTNQGEG
ncbi:MAG: hypothetical protein ACRED4_00660 [Brevundimonas sp.]